MEEFPVASEAPNSHEPCEGNTFIPPAPHCIFATASIAASFPQGANKNILDDAEIFINKDRSQIGVFLDKNLCGGGARE